METSVKQRLIEFLKLKKLSQHKFQKEIGVSNGYVNNIRTSIQPDKLLSIAIKFPDLNIGWLLTGIGETLLCETYHSPEIITNPKTEYERLQDKYIAELEENKELNKENKKLNSKIVSLQEKIILLNEKMSVQSDL